LLGTGKNGNGNGNSRQGETISWRFTKGEMGSCPSA